MKLTFSKFMKLMSTDLVESDLLFPIAIEAYVITASMLINMYSVIFIYGMITGQSFDNENLLIGILILVPVVIVIIRLLNVLFTIVTTCRKCSNKEFESYYDMINYIEECLIEIKPYVFECSKIYIFMVLVSFIVLLLTVSLNLLIF